MRKLLFGLLALLLASTATVATTTPPADAASTFRGWEFTPTVSATRSDGLSLNDVSYNGLKIFERVSLPVMNVFYDNNACGPYVDRIGGTRYTNEGPTEFTQNGVRWLQIGLTDQLGAYTITQMFYLSENGDFDVHMFSKGLQCNIRHDHVPFWRLDFAIAGDSNDQIRRATNNGMVAMTNEFSMSATAAVDHGWEVHDTVTGDYVTIDFDDGNFGLGNDQVIPETDYLQNNVFGRQYRSSEQAWQGGATYGLFGDNGESITDAVLWYNGFMPHSAEEGTQLWHSTGIRMRVNPEPVNQQATISGSVLDLSGNPAQIDIDRFTENRVAYVESTTSDTNGAFSFDVDPGCHVLTYIAPSGASFGSGSRYEDRTVCVAAGENSTGNDVTVVLPGSGAASVGDRVTYSDGTPAAGVGIDLYTENRAQYMASTTTDSNGNYRFDLADSMCGVVTFIAPAGEVFSANGGRYLNQSFCADAGQDLTDIDAELVVAGQGAEIGGRVTNRSNQGVSDVLAVLYQATSDGSRGQFLGSAETDNPGNYRFSVTAGCFVIDLVAPGGRTWVATGGLYQQLFGCVEAGETDVSLNGVLN
ncbi:MAG: hypothetical protein ACRBK7_25995 [Acidimicrobiales bacterium]